MTLPEPRLDPDPLTVPEPEPLPKPRGDWGCGTVLAALALAVILAGCASRPEQSVAGESGIGYVHDAAHHVSCWTFGGGMNTNTAAISCLPDSQVFQP